MLSTIAITIVTSFSPNPLAMHEKEILNIESTIEDSIRGLNFDNWKKIKRFSKLRDQDLQNALFDQAVPPQEPKYEMWDIFEQVARLQNHIQAWNRWKTADDNFHGQAKLSEDKEELDPYSLELVASIPSPNLLVVDTLIEFNISEATVQNAYRSKLSSCSFMLAMSYFGIFFCAAIIAEAFLYFILTQKQEIESDKERVSHQRLCFARLPGRIRRVELIRVSPPKDHDDIKDAKDSKRRISKETPEMAF